MILFSSLLKVLFLRLNFNSAAHIGNELGSLCFSKAISEDYENQQLVNSSVILNLLTGNVDATTAAINNLLMLTSSIASSITIVISIAVLNYKLTLALITVISLMYCFIVNSSKHKLKRIGCTIQATGILRNRIIQESRGSLRDIILSNARPYVCNSYTENDKALKLAGAQSLFLSGYPRQLLEFTGYSLIGLIALFNFEEKGLIVTLAPLFLRFSDYCHLSNPFI